MANTFKFGNGNWAVKEDFALAYNDENGNFKPLPFDFTRASSATRVNKNGLIETVPSGKPRIDFLDNTSGHLLLEPSRTNLVTYSEDFSQSVWNELRATITANSTTSPDGSNTATLLKEDTTASNTHIIYYGGSLASSTYSMSVFAKAKERTKIGLGTGNIAQSAIFDLSNGTIINNGAHTAYISYFGNGWYRCNITTTTTTPIRIVLIDNNNNTSYTGDGVSGLYIWGAQIESGSYATSIIKTEGSTVTRSAETANAAGNSTVFNDSEGVLYAEMAALANDGGSRRLGISDSSATNRVILGFTSSDNQIQGFTSNSGTQANMTHTVSDATAFNKIAIKYKANDFALWINGVEVGTDTSGTAPSGLTEAAFDEGYAAGYFYGKCKDFKVYDTALSDSELQALTS